MAVQLLGVSKAAFDGFFSSFVYPFAALFISVRLDLFFVFFPDVARDDFHAVVAARAFFETRTLVADFRVGLVFAVSAAVGGCVFQDSVFRARVAVEVLVVVERALFELAFFAARTDVGHYPVNVAIAQPFADRGGVISRIQPDGLDLEPEPPALAVQPPQMRNAVVHIAGGDMYVRDEIVLPVDRAVVEIKEALRLPVPDHIAAVRIRCADFCPLRFRFGRGLILQRLFPAGLSILRNIRIQFIPFNGLGLLELLLDILVLVRTRFQVRRVRIEHFIVYQLRPDRLQHDLIKNLLINPRARKALLTVPADRRMIRHAIGQPQPQEPAVRRIVFNLLLQPPLGTDAEQVADEQHHRVNRRTPVVRAVQVFDLVVDK